MTALLLNTFVHRALPHTRQREGMRLLSGSNSSLPSITEEEEIGMRTITLVSALVTALYPETEVVSSHMARGVMRMILTFCSSVCNMQINTHLHLTGAL